jgi:hypothetical protein
VTVSAYDSGERVIVDVDFDTPAPLLLLTIGPEGDEPFRLSETEAERVIVGLQEGLKLVRSAKAKPSPSTP